MTALIITHVNPTIANPITPAAITALSAASWSDWMRSVRPEIAPAR